MSKDSPQPAKEPATRYSPGTPRVITHMHRTLKESVADPIHKLTLTARAKLKEAQAKLKESVADLPTVVETIMVVALAAWAITWIPPSTRSWAAAAGATAGTVFVALFATSYGMGFIYLMPWVWVGAKKLIEFRGRVDAWLVDAFRGSAISAAVYYGVGIGVTLRLTDYHWGAIAGYMRAHLLDPLALAVFVSVGLITRLGQDNGTAYVVGAAGAVGLAASFVAGGDLTVCLVCLWTAAAFVALAAPMFLESLGPGRDHDRRAADPGRPPTRL